MRAPDFWWKPDSLGSTMLAPLGAIYGEIARRRLAGPSYTAPVPVICIGNFVAGGAGKTPVALEVARRLLAMGRKPVFLTRGYGGSLREPTVVDTSLHDAGMTGDEPQLLAAVAPTVVARRRDAGATLAARMGDVIVMDDGLQNPAVAKTLTIAVVDGGVGLGAGRCIPAGPLRAPMEAQWPLVRAVVIMGPGDAGRRVVEAAAAHGVTVLRATLEPTADGQRLKGKRVFAFAGIGRPAKVFETLEKLGAEVVRTRSFADHQPYTARVIARLLEEAETGGFTAVTTEKDMARIRPAVPAAVAGRFEVLSIRAAFENPDALDRLLRAAINAA